MSGNTPVWRLAFAGAPAFAATVLERLIASRHQVERVFTQPHRRAGRGRRLKRSAVAGVAEAAGIETLTPRRLRAEGPAFAGFDLLVVAAYGLLLPAEVLQAPKHGCINVHASLLPRWRGAAPVEHAIMAGDETTGVSIMQIDEGLDTGPVYRTRTLPLGDDATGATVTTELAAIGAECLLDVLDELPDAPSAPQDERFATYAPKLTSADSRIDWQRDAVAISRQVRALTGRAAAYTTGEAGLRLRIHAARPLTARAAERGAVPPGTLAKDGRRWLIGCGSGALEVGVVQLNRGKGTRLDMRSAVNGYRRMLYEGARFG